MIIVRAFVLAAEQKGAGIALNALCPRTNYREPARAVRQSSWRRTP